MTSKSVLFLVPYPLMESPSQRFRFEQYFELLRNHGYQLRVESFLDSANWQIAYKSGNSVRKLAAVIKGLLQRIVLLLKARKFDFVFIHREAAPLGPPLFEWIVIRILKRKVIYDFDDAIWITDRLTESRMLRLLKYRDKVKLICRWSWKVSAGNLYLSSFAKKFNQRSILNPTTIDTINWHNPDLFEKLASTGKTTIGWTGSHSTLKYLYAIESLLQDLENEFENLQFIVIADRKPSLALRTMIFIPWRLDSEIQDLLRIDIGIMPLPDDQWSHGKCGFKLLQYMSLGIPAVGSRVGVNSSIVDHGINGFLCHSNIEWKETLTKLILDKNLRERIGQEGRKKVINQFSVTSNSSNFLSLFA